MQIKSFIKPIIILTILALNIGCDQISKNKIRQKIEYGDKIILINNFLVLTKVQNSGAFLSLGNTLPKPIKKIIMTILPIIFIGFTLIFLFIKKNIPKLAILGICFFVGGGISNIFDRIIYGSVTDFLHINFVIFQTGIFNLADVSIMTGIFIILAHSYLERIHLNFNFYKKSNE